MNYIYINRRSGNHFILNPMITMADKVCLINLSTSEEKFYSPKTIKRWCTLTRTEDTFVEIKAFTGMNIGLYPVHFASDKEFFVETKSGKTLWFDAETMIQTNAKNPKFANKAGVYHDYRESTLNWIMS